MESVLRETGTYPDKVKSATVHLMIEHIDQALGYLSMMTSSTLGSITPSDKEDFQVILDAFEAEYDNEKSFPSNFQHQGADPRTVDLIVDLNKPECVAAFNMQTRLIAFRGELCRSSSAEMPGGFLDYDITSYDRWWAGTKAQWANVVAAPSIRRAPGQEDVEPVPQLEV